MAASSSLLRAAIRCSLYTRITTIKAIHSLPADIPSPDELTGYTVSTEEFKYVERLLPKKCIPEMPDHESYPTPSGWFPPAGVADIKTPYYVERTRNHQYPVYLESIMSRHRTIIRKIGGDIWALEADLREHLEAHSDSKVLLRVHEVARQIRIKGAYTRLVSEFLQSRGF